ncbi:MAG: hypothetical protein UX10_C0015G0018 [Candidatus Magasanikbacteria bacterium GW2011_GWA2_45_39]|uniref:Uncharacterized protein n=1 Tax=Candidatus Magasanikbacteria bacterium GW2011_GWA2_45_39 TaxID=1619041 RepID=A0A0G1MGE5_9BACT|nr:MAG: hypothetical protein UX10_C0015G0018 [Candidatus Magasanikbacteria bacterium GW2011_GWA2_45_39]
MAESYVVHRHEEQDVEAPRVVLRAVETHPQEAVEAGIVNEVVDTHSLISQAETLAAEVESGETEVERIAQNHQEPIPKTLRERLVALKETARQALNTFKKDILKLPTAPRNELRSHLSVLLDQLNPAFLKKIEDDNGRRQVLENFFKEMEDLAMVDPEGALDILLQVYKKIGSQFEITSFVNGVYGVIAEFDPELVFKNRVKLATKFGYLSTRKNFVTLDNCEEIWEYIESNRKTKDPKLWVDLEFTGDSKELHNLLVENSLQEGNLDRMFEHLVRFNGELDHRSIWRWKVAQDAHGRAERLTDHKEQKRILKMLLVLRPYLKIDRYGTGWEDTNEYKDFYKQTPEAIEHAALFDKNEQLIKQLSGTCSEQELGSKREESKTYEVVHGSGWVKLLVELLGKTAGTKSEEVVLAKLKKIVEDEDHTATDVIAKVLANNVRIFEPEIAWKIFSHPELAGSRLDRGIGVTILMRIAFADINKALPLFVEQMKRGDDSTFTSDGAPRYSLIEALAQRFPEQALAVVNESVEEGSDDFERFYSTIFNNMPLDEVFRLIGLVKERQQDGSFLLRNCVQSLVGARRAKDFDIDFMKNLYELSTTDSTQREEYSEFFDSPDLQKARDVLGDEFVRGCLLSFFGSDRGPYSIGKKANMEFFLRIISAPIIARLVSEFPSEKDFIHSQVQVAIKYSGSGVVFEKRFLALDPSAPKEDLFTELVIFDTKIIKRAVSSGLINQLNIQKLSERMAGQNMDWQVIAELPPDSFDEWKEPLKQQAESLRTNPNMECGGAMADSLVRSLHSKDGFMGQKEHLQWLYKYLRNQNAGNKTVNENRSKFLNAVLGAQETIANKNLRNRLEKYFFERTFHAIRPVSKDLTGVVPKDMHASLGLLVSSYGMSEDMIERLGKTLFTGNVFKHRTNLDKFNYFLLEGSVIDDDTDSNATRAFFERGMPLMEMCNEAKRKIFDLTQVVRYLGFLGKNHKEELFTLNAELYRIGTATESLLAERANEWGETIRQEIEGIKRDNDGHVLSEKDQRKIEQQIKKREDRLLKGPSESETAKWKAELPQKIAQQLDVVLAEYRATLIGAFKEKCGVDLNEKEVTGFLERFKDPGLVFTYSGKLEGYEGQKKLFQSFIESVAHGTFPEVRYTHREHLDKVFKGDKEKEQLWKQNVRIEHHQDTEAPGAPEEVLGRERIVGFMREALFHNHVEGEYKTTMDEFIEADEEDKSKIIVSAEARLQAMKAEEKALPQGKLVRAVLNSMKILSATASELGRGTLYDVVTPDGKKRKGAALDQLFKEMASAFADDSPFQNDITAMQGVVRTLKEGQKKQNTEGFVAEESEDPDLLLRMGIDVSGSCQNVNGSPELNRNLISYVMDGKIKTIFVRDVDGEIMGRSILRILYDEESKTPVVHLERSYHREGAPIQVVNDMLFSVAEEKTRQMGLPLVISGKFNANHSLKPYGHVLISYGGPGTTEYVDTIGGSHSDQKYGIEGNLVSVVV